MSFEGLKEYKFADFSLISATTGSILLEYNLYVEFKESGLMILTGPVHREYNLSVEELNTIMATG